MCLKIWSDFKNSGMTNVDVPYNETKDPFGKKWGPKDYKKYSRDFERSPMQWNGSKNII